MTNWVLIQSFRPSVRLRRVFAPCLHQTVGSEKVWLCGTSAALCVLLPLLILTLDLGGHVEFALQQRDARYV